MKRNSNKHIKSLKRASEQYGTVLDDFLRHWSTGKRNSRRLSDVMHGTLRKLNQVMTAMGEVPATYQTHYNGGVKKLIEVILRKRRAFLQDSRAETIKVAMFTEQIVYHTKRHFTDRTARYRQQTVQNALVEMAQKNEIGKIKLKPGEVVQRNGSKGRLKWYLED